MNKKCPKIKRFMMPYDSMNKLICVNLPKLDSLRCFIN